MEIIRITSIEESFANDLIELYLETFPENQRHNKLDFENLLRKENDFFANVALMNSSPIGFFNYWNFDDFVFLEHLAVEPPMRGYKLGEKLINLLKDIVEEKTIILEVEKADDSEFGERRIEFYRRLGFELVPIEYEQPPYREGESYLPLHIMSNNVSFAMKKFDEIKSALYRKVYKIK